MNNHNHLLGKVAGVDGLKTGYTAGAGFCISTTAERNGRRVVVVAMGGPDAKSRDLKVAELVETGFAHMPPPQTIASAPKPIDAGAPNLAPKPAALPATEKVRSAPTRPAPAEEPMIKLNLPAVKK